MKIKVFADTICGWCFIGQTRLNKALKAFPETEFEIEHVPFQLNTDMPKEGIDTYQYPGIDTVIKAFDRTAKRIPNKNCFGTRVGNKYEWMSFKEV